MNAKFGEYAKICSEIIDLVNLKAKMSYFFYFKDGQFYAEKHMFFLLFLLSTNFEYVPLADR